MGWDALVLAGGGVAGIAWETGVLLGLIESSPAISKHLASSSTRYIGTSAGSAVAAQLASGTALQVLFDAQISEAAAEIATSVDLQAFAATMKDSLVGAASPDEARRRIGSMARGAVTPSPAARRTVIKSRLPTHAWSDREVLITAVATDSGEFHVFDRTSGVSLVDAVAASCAVPGIWPSVEINGTYYMDGGMRTLANADLAAGADRVLILVPGPEVSAMGAAIPVHELEALSSSRVHVVYADQASITVMGTDPLDPATRGPAAGAGRRVGQQSASVVAALWD